MFHENSKKIIYTYSLSMALIELLNYNDKHFDIKSKQSKRKQNWIK